jgi:hypothetical protein
MARIPLVDDSEEVRGALGAVTTLSKPVGLPELQAGIRSALDAPREPRDPPEG